MSRLSLHEEGAEHFVQALTEGQVKALEATLTTAPTDCAGTRLTNQPELAALIGPQSIIAQHPARHLGPTTRPVRAILFDKSPQTNWALGWHQDRTIAVRTRIETPGFGPWTIKQGIQHVAPPQSLLDRMLTLRVHLDDVPADNAPLLIALGTHHLGRIAEANIARHVAASTVHACLASRGDIWLYATPILHASDRATTTTRRRVLQVDYSADTLPPPLQWLGV